MSNDAIRLFSEAVRKDPALLEKVKAVGSNVDGMVALARESGFTFTAQELKEAADAGKGELSEEQLQKLSGGGSWVQVQTVAVHVAVVG